MWERFLWNWYLSNFFAGRCPSSLLSTSSPSPRPPGQSPTCGLACWGLCRGARRPRCYRSRSRPQRRPQHHLLHRRHRSRSRPQRRPQHHLLHRRHRSRSRPQRRPQHHLLHRRLPKLRHGGHDGRQRPGGRAPQQQRWLVPLQHRCQQFRHGVRRRPRGRAPQQQRWLVPLQHRRLPLRQSRQRPRGRAPQQQPPEAALRRRPTPFRRPSAAAGPSPLLPTAMAGAASFSGTPA